MSLNKIMARLIRIRATQVSLGVILGNAQDDREPAEDLNSAVFLHNEINRQLELLEDDLRGWGTECKVSSNDNGKKSDVNDL